MCKQNTNKTFMVHSLCEILNQPRKRCEVFQLACFYLNLLLALYLPVIHLSTVNKQVKLFLIG